jgi:hypothetical protein
LNKSSINIFIISKKGFNMKKFNEYKSARDLYEFDKKFDGLCESIFKSGLTFEQYWKNFALPILIESNSFENENQLLNEFSWNPRNWFRKNPSDAAPASAPASSNPDINFDALNKFVFPNPMPYAFSVLRSMDVSDPKYKEITNQRKDLLNKLQQIFLSNKDNSAIEYIAYDWINGNYKEAKEQFEKLKNKYPAAPSDSSVDKSSIKDPAIQDPNMTPERQKKLAAFQQKADQQINQIKSDFKVAMRSFLKQASDQAKDQGDHHMWQIAQVFYKKIMDTSSPIIDGFKLKAKFGKPAYKEPFSKERDAMQMNRTNTLKSNLEKKAEERKAAAAAAEADAKRKFDMDAAVNAYGTGSGF